MPSVESESLPEGEWQVQVARFLPKLQTLWAWVKRCSQVCQELVAQLVALYSTQYNGKPLVCASEVHFQVKFQRNKFIAFFLFDLSVEHSFVGFLAGGIGAFG